MIYPSFFENKNTLNLFGLERELNFLISLRLKKKLPKVIMLTGNKGSGKSTLVNHFFYSIFDEKNYDNETLKLCEDSALYKQFKNDIFPNIVYMKGSDFHSIKIEDVRNLKKKIFQSSISTKDRFIVFDDVEQFNVNSLNAVLKIIEEPSNQNYFFLINNKSKPLLETIKSRCLEIKIMLNDEKRLEIIEKLTNYLNIDQFLNPLISQLSPGNYLKFNHICIEYSISLKNNLIENLSLLLNLYKKNKEILFINVLFFVVDYYFDHLKDSNLYKNGKIFEIKKYILNNLNNFILYNISQNSLINSINEKLNYE